MLERESWKESTAESESHVEEGPGVGGLSGSGGLPPGGEQAGRQHQLPATGVEAFPLPTPSYPPSPPCAVKYLQEQFCALESECGQLYGE